MKLPTCIYSYDQNVQRVWDQLRTLSEKNIDGFNIADDLFDDVSFAWREGRGTNPPIVTIPLLDTENDVFFAAKVASGVTTGMELRMPTAGKFCIVDKDDVLERQIISLILDGDDGKIYTNYGKAKLGTSAAYNWELHRNGTASLWDDGTNLSTIRTIFQLGGATSSYPMLKRSSTNIQFRKADDSAYGGWVSQTGQLRGTGLNNGTLRFYDPTDTYYIQLSASPAGAFSWGQTLPDKAGVVGVATGGAVVTPAADSIPIADGSNKLAAGWISEVLATSDLSDSTGKTGSGAKLVSASAAGSTGAIPKWSSSDLGSSGFTESGTDWSTSSILTITGAATGLTIRAADKLYMKITGGSGTAAGFQDSLGNSPISIADQQHALMSYGGRSIKCNYAGTMQFDGVTGSQNYFARWSANGVPVDGGISDDGSTIGITRSTVTGPGASTFTVKSSASQNFDIQAGSSGILYLRNSSGVRVFGIDGSGNVLWGVTQGTAGTLMRFDSIGAAADSGITDSGSILTLTRDTTVTAGKKLTCTGNETEAGLNLGQLGGDPSSPNSGDVWGRSSGLHKTYVNASTRTIPVSSTGTAASKPTLLALEFYATSDTNELIMGL